ncbi:MAG: VOC family protein [Betaproteobacteria bacterium]
MATGDPQTGLVIYAKDLRRVAAFYEGMLGIAPVHADDVFVTLELPGVQLVVHQIPPHIAADIVIGDPPAVREDTAIKPVLVVASLATARAAATMLGGALEDAACEWRHGDAVVCNGFDPEGNVVAFSARAR